MKQEPSFPRPENHREALVYELKELVEAYEGIRSSEHLDRKELGRAQEAIEHFFRAAKINWDRFPQVVLSEEQLHETKAELTETSMRLIPQGKFWKRLPDRVFVLDAENVSLRDPVSKKSYSLRKDGYGITKYNEWQVGVARFLVKNPQYLGDLLGD